MQMFRDVALGLCDENLGDMESRKADEQVLRASADQTEAAARIESIF